MENLIIKNLLEQIEKLTEENKNLKENTITNEIMETNIIKETQNHYLSIEQLVSEKYDKSMTIDDFELYIKTKITEEDLFDCINKSVQEVIINVLTRELSNKEIRPIHKNKYYVVKIGDKWVKKEYYDFEKIIKRLTNIVSHTISGVLFNCKKSKSYTDGGSSTHSYKHYRFDYDELTLKLYSDINHSCINKNISNKLHINL